MMIIDNVGDHHDDHHVGDLSCIDHVVFDDGELPQDGVGMTVR